MVRRRFALLGLAVVSALVAGTLAGPGAPLAEADNGDSELPLVDGGQFLFWPADLGEVQAANVFGTVKIAWLFSTTAVNWTSFVPALGVVDYLVIPGSVLWIVSDGAQMLVIETAVEPDPEPDSGLGDDLRVMELGTLPPGGGSFDLTVEEGESSFLVYAKAPMITHLVAIVNVIGPGGESVVAPNSLVSNIGESALLIPQIPAIVIVPGVYTVFVESRVGTTVGAIVKTAADGFQVIDATFWVATSSGELKTEEDREALAAIYRTRGDQIFNSQGLGIGEITFADPPQAVIDEYASIAVPAFAPPTELSEVCLEMSEAFGDDRSVHLVLVDEITDVGGESNGTLGIASGIPGATILGGMWTSCVLVTANLDGFGAADNAGTVWHEVGHLLGLFHTSESSGDSFDFFNDTPECAFAKDANADGFVDKFECPDGSNFIFYNSEGTEISVGQAALMGNHPLFHS